MYPKLQLQKIKSLPDNQQRLLTLSYATLASVALSIVLALTTHFSQMSRGSAEIGKIRIEMTEIKQQMADRRDLQEVRTSLLQVEKDVKKLSDHLPKGH